MTTDKTYKRTMLMQTAAAVAADYEVEVKLRPLDSSGIDIATRGGRGGRWYNHGWFGADADLATALIEIGDSFTLQYGRRP